MVNVIEVKRLSLSFQMYDRGFSQRLLKVVSNLNAAVGEGEILAVAGSSGSGKSLLAHALLGILPKNARLDGEMRWFGAPLDAALQKRLRGREMALVPQSVTYLDPLIRVGRQISRDKQTVNELLGRYHLKPEAAGLFPHELSGGMTRRVMISTALARRPKLVIADEPTPGLSPRLAEHAMRHFREIADTGTAVLLITHDIDLAIRYADRVAVFYAGTAVETAKASDFADAALLRHPYSKALWAAMPQNGFTAAAGAQPYAGDWPPGCLYAPRCPECTPACVAALPDTRVVRGGEVSCRHAR
ncbi:MAG: ABC transporter ATP-binding protein [Oscillospiraceae bacterium]|jgi:peptide/nickel transport system ATP-binding protein|nr:ABC transporter ATP-binding protein [Oscillospiraceae bacterium]